jgi:hypothetical protein
MQVEHVGFLASHLVFRARQPEHATATLRRLSLRIGCESIAISFSRRRSVRCIYWLITITYHIDMKGDAGYVYNYCTTLKLVIRISPATPQIAGYMIMFPKFQHSGNDQIEKHISTSGAIKV